MGVARNSSQPLDRSRKEKAMPKQYPGSLPYRSILGLLLIIGCAPEMRRPQSTGLNWTAENRLTSTGRSVGSSRIASGGPSSSSLDALRRGDSTATPPSSPLQDVYFEFDRYENGRTLAQRLTRMQRGLKNIRRSECRSRDTAMSAAPTSTIWGWLQNVQRRPEIT